MRIRVKKSIKEYCKIPCELQDWFMPVYCMQEKNHKDKHKVTHGFAKLHITYEWEDGFSDRKR